jgi:Protein of unknown function (DUF3604)
MYCSIGSRPLAVLFAVSTCLAAGIVYDAFRFGVEIPEGAETTHQERAYTSPIW